MGFTQAQLDALEEAIALGHTRVEYTDPTGSSQKVEYASLDDLIRRRDIVARALGVTPRPARFYGVPGKGL